jgi:hypothetical protein
MCRRWEEKGVSYLWIVPNNMSSCRHYSCYFERKLQGSTPQCIFQWNGMAPRIWTLSEHPSTRGSSIQNLKNFGFTELDEFWNFRQIWTGIQLNWLVEPLVFGEFLWIQKWLETRDGWHSAEMVAWRWEDWEEGIYIALRPPMLSIACKELPAATGCFRWFYTWGSICGLCWTLGGQKIQVGPNFFGWFHFISGPTEMDEFRSNSGTQSESRFYEGWVASPYFELLI